MKKLVILLTLLGGCLTSINATQTEVLAQKMAQEILNKNTYANYTHLHNDALGYLGVAVAIPVVTYLAASIAAQQWGRSDNGFDQLARIGLVQFAGLAAFLGSLGYAAHSEYKAQQILAFLAQAASNQ